MLRVINFTIIYIGSTLTGLQRIQEIRRNRKQIIQNNLASPEKKLQIVEIWGKAAIGIIIKLLLC